MASTTGPKHDAEDAEDLQPAEHGKEDEKLVQLGLFAHQFRAQEIINRADDERSPSGQDNCFDPEARRELERSLPEPRR